MPSDSVLRCLTRVKLRGKVDDYILDAVMEGERVLLVLEWGIEDGVKGRSPRQFVEVNGAEISVIPDVESGYELVSSVGIDLDEATVTDTEPSDRRFYWEPPLI